MSWDVAVATSSRFKKYDGGGAGSWRPYKNDVFLPVMRDRAAKQGALLADMQKGVLAFFTDGSAAKHEVTSGQADLFAGMRQAQEAAEEAECNGSTRQNIHARIMTELTRTERAATLATKRLEAGIAWDMEHPPATAPSTEQAAARILARREFTSSIELSDREELTISVPHLSEIVPDMQGFLRFMSDDTLRFEPAIQAAGTWLDARIGAPTSSDVASYHALAPKPGETVEDLLQRAELLGEPMLRQMGVSVVCGKVASVLAQHVFYFKNSDAIKSLPGKVVEEWVRGGKAAKAKELKMQVGEVMDQQVEFQAFMACLREGHKGAAVHKG